MNYYLKDNDGGIKTYSSDRNSVQTMVKYFPELKDKTIYETEREIIILDNKPVFADEHQEEITEQEELEQAQKEQQENEEALADLKDRMVTADLQGDEDWKADLREEYAELMGDGEESEEDEPTEEQTEETENE